MDMAVAYLGPSGDHQARVYRNTGGSLTTAPWWKSKDTTTFFDCCLGDVNLDGYLDLAIAAGDAYSSTSEPLKIYFNRSGVLDTLPDWQSSNRVLVDAVRFADLNNDGRLDLIADGKGFVYVSLPPRRHAGTQSVLGGYSKREHDGACGSRSATMTMTAGLTLPQSRMARPARPTQFGCITTTPGRWPSPRGMDTGTKQPLTLMRGLG